MSKVCRKKPFTLKQVKGYLHALKNKIYSKRPWRNEVSYYKCEVCKKYHTSSIIDAEGKTMISSAVSYFDHQKEKWGAFLQQTSSTKARIPDRKRKK